MKLHMQSPHESSMDPMDLGSIHAIFFWGHSGIFGEFFWDMTFFWDKYCKLPGHFLGHFE